MTEISVVVPTKDRLPYLRKAIPMFLRQEEVKEVVVVIDGSLDGTIEYVEALSRDDERVRYVDNGRNMGLPYSRNKGIELAECEYVFTGEDDLELSDNFFTILLAHMRQEDADIISGRNIFRIESETIAEAIDRTNQIKGSSVDLRAITVQPGMNAAGDQVQTLLPAPMLARADLFRKVRFDDAYRGNAWREESDFQLSAKERGYKMVFCPHAVSFNLMIENDRGGAHSWIGAKRVWWIVRNNWRFVRKHRGLISQEFESGNQYVYLARFATRRICTELILPPLIDTKQRMLAVGRGSADSRLPELPA
jgi:GT2 family glycosyltransferase